MLALDDFESADAGADEYTHPLSSLRRNLETRLGHGFLGRGKSKVDEAEVTPGASFQEDLGADSLDVVELVMQFEEAFDMEIPDEDAEKITRVKEAVEYIEAHAKKK